MIGDDDFHGGGEEFEVFGFVGCAEDVGVGGVGLFGGHLVAEAGFLVMKADISARPPSSSMNVASSQGL